MTHDRQEKSLYSLAYCFHCVRDIHFLLDSHVPFRLSTADVRCNEKVTESSKIWRLYRCSEKAERLDARCLRRFVLPHSFVSVTDK